MSREQRTFGNALFVNLARIPFLVSEADLLHMAAEISDWSPQFLDVDPVHGARFALYCEQHGLKFPSLKFILCSYELSASCIAKFCRAFLACRFSTFTARPRPAICSWKTSAAK